MSIVITKQPKSLVVTRLKHPMSIQCDTNRADATYQWQHQVDGVWITIPGATAKEYSVAEWNGLDGFYRCKATSGGVYVYTNVSTMQTDNSLPVITIGAVNGPWDAVPEDKEVHVHVDAGTSDDKLPLTYQWTVNSKKVEGATTADFRVEHVTPAMAGTWSCELRSGNALSIASTKVKVSTESFIRIITAPVATTVHAGTNATFNCGILTNVDDVKYQWYTKGVGEHTWQKLYKKNEPVLDFVASSTDNNQEYKCILTSDYAETVESTPVILTVTGAVTVSITTQPTPIANAIPESEVSFTVVAETNAPAFPMLYQWYHGANLIPGAEEATYTTIVSQASAGAYKCEVYGGKDFMVTAQSNEAALTVKSAPATITITHQPEAVNNCSGVPFMLMVEATESDNKQLHYQWEASGEVIPGATSNVFEVQDPSELDSGMYKCVVTSGTGAGKATATSNTAHVVITDSLPIVLTVKDNLLVDQSVMFNQMIDLTIEAVTTGEYINYQWYKVLPVVGARPEKVGTNYHQYISFAGRETAKFYCVVTSHEQVHKTKEVTITVADSTRFLDIKTPAYSVVTAQTGRQDISVHVETHDGQAPVKYVWYRANIGGTDDPIPGSTTDTITVHDVELNQHHIIYCEMTLDSVADGPKARSKYVHIYGSDAHVLDYHVNPLPHRNTSFMYVDYWVIDEIQNTIANGDDWIFGYKTMKYSKDVETIITAINKYGSTLMLESRNGRLEASELLVNPILG